MRNTGRPAPEQPQIEQLEATLRALQESVTEHYCQIGKQLIEVANAEKVRIDSLVDQIIRIRHELAILRKEKECSYCATQNDHDSVYCKRCGKRIEEKEATP